MYCSTCELEIKGDDKDTCPVCGAPLSDSQEESASSQDPQEQPAEEEIFKDTRTQAEPDGEPTAAVLEEDVFVLKDYAPDSLSEDELSAMPQETDAQTLKESSQGSIESMKEVLDSIRESIAMTDNSEEEQASAGAVSERLDDDFSFFDSQEQDSEIAVSSENTTDDKAEVSWEFDEAAAAVSMPVPPDRTRSPVFKIVLLVVLLVIGGYYAFSLTSDDAGRDAGRIKRSVMPIAALHKDNNPTQPAVETDSVSNAQAVEEPAPAGDAVLPVLGADSDVVQNAQLITQQSFSAVEPQPGAEMAAEPSAAAGQEALSATTAAPVEGSTSQSAAAVHDVKPAELPAAVEPAVLSASGQTPVRATTSEPAVSPKVAKPITVPFFTVHVGSYRKRASASSEVSRMQAKGYDSFIERVDLGQRGIWYRVKVGRFKNRAEAERVQKKIEKVLVTDSMVVTQRTN